MKGLRSTVSQPFNRGLYPPNLKIWQNASYNFRELMVQAVAHRSGAVVERHGHLQSSAQTPTGATASFFVLKSVR